MGERNPIANRLSFQTFHDEHPEPTEKVYEILKLVHQELIGISVASRPYAGHGFTSPAFAPLIAKLRQRRLVSSVIFR
jgi:hypothetical protein